MGTIVARALITKAQVIIQDLTGVRWPLNEMLGWLNEGQRAIVSVRPDSNSATRELQLVAGTRQTITGLRLLDVIRNTGPSGDSPSRAPRLIEREILDSQVPDWHSATPNAIAKHWVYDGRDPRTFYVFPPQPVSGRGYVDIVQSEAPANCTLKDVQGEDGATGSEDSVVSLDDIYETALIEWIVYRSYCKNQTYVTSGRAESSYAKFAMFLGVKTQTDIGFDPKNSAPPVVNPNVPGNSGPFGG